MFKRIMAPIIKCLLGSIAILVVPSLQAQLFGPFPYLSDADSPLDDFNPANGNYLIDFEPGYNLVGTSINNGNVTGPGGLTDSVDGDDGSIDGFGTNGRSWFWGNGPGGITIDLNASNDFGEFPKYAGVVWTDAGGGASVTFSAINGNGDPMGSITAPALADGSNSGTTGEDSLFFAVDDTFGIQSIFISNSSGGIEIDHLQFSVFTVPTAVPEPRVYALLAGLLALGFVVYRKRIQKTDTA